MTLTRRAEAAIVGLIACVQFVNIVDFMMVMPLGPDFARDLGIPASKLGYVGGSYMLASAVAGTFGALWLDRFGRRAVLTVALLGLTVGTALGAVAESLESMLAARVVAGFFGGPATTISYAILADVVPAERRGRAMGSMMGAFSAASVLGVPFALFLAERSSWHAPFLVLAGTGVFATALARSMLPVLDGHVAACRAPRLADFAELLARPIVRASYAMTFCAMLGAFLVIPNIAAYLQENLGYPRAALDQLYLMGGAASFVVLRLAGMAADRYGVGIVSAVGTVSLGAVLTLGFALVSPWLPVPVIFVLFMCSMSTRNVAYVTLTSKIPAAHERARFTSFQQSVQGVAMGLGALASTQLLHVREDGALIGMPLLATMAIVLASTLPFFVAHIGRLLRARDAASHGAAVTAPTT